MNTVLHIHDEHHKVVLSLLIKVAPEVFFGCEPAIGKRVWIGALINESDEKPYTVVEMGEEIVEDFGIVSAFTIKPQKMLNS